MSDPRFPNPYAGPTPGTGLAPDATVIARPDARTQAAFLTQAFLWMFVGLAVTAGVAFIVQSNQKLLQFTSGAVMPPLMSPPPRWRRRANRDRVAPDGLHHAPRALPAG